MVCIAISHLNVPSTLKIFFLRVLFRRKGRPRPTQVEHQDTGPGDEQPRELPVELWGNCLQGIHLQGNQIMWLPDYLGSLSGLTRLDISG